MPLLQDEGCGVADPFHFDHCSFKTLHDAANKPRDY
jgi:hypothetical protein